MTTTTSDTAQLDSLDPQPGPLTLSTGLTIELERLRTRQFFRLLRILTKGAGANLAALRVDPAEDPKAFATKLVTLLVMSLPAAENESIAFLQSMTRPAGLYLDKYREPNKQQAENNARLWARWETDLDNPELDDLATLVEAIVHQEAADLQALGKRLMAMFKIAEKTGQLRSTGSPDGTSSTGSPARSTSSPASTDGTTSASASFPSADSDRSSPPSPNGAPSAPGAPTSDSWN